MDVRGVNGNVIQVTPPACRVDLEREADLVEEVARLEGYDKIDVTFPNIRPVDEPNAPKLVVSDRVRQIMVGLGFMEILSYSFISPDSADILKGEEGSKL